MKNEKHQQAYNLYFQTDLSQLEIARLLDVDRKTIHNWLSEGNWRQLKKLAQHVPSKIVEQYYYMLANLNHEILSRAHQPYPLTHEAEQMRKIAVTIRHLKNRQTVNESMEAYTHLAETISLTDPGLAAQLRPHIQAYIHNRAAVKFADCVAPGYNCNPDIGELFDYEIRPFDDKDTEVDLDAALAYAQAAASTRPVPGFVLHPTVVNTDTTTEAAPDSAPNPDADDLPDGGISIPAGPQSPVPVPGRSYAAYPTAGAGSLSATSSVSAAWRSHPDDDPEAALPVSTPAPHTRPPIPAAA